MELLVDFVGQSSFLIEQKLLSCFYHVRERLEGSLGWVFKEFFDSIVSYIGNMWDACLGL